MRSTALKFAIASFVSAIGVAAANIYPAQAAVTFNLGGTDAAADSLLYPEKHVNLTVTSGPGNSQVIRSNNGLGINSQTGNLVDADTDEVSQFGGEFSRDDLTGEIAFRAREQLRLSFDEVVRLVSAEFTQNETGETFRLKVGDNIAIMSETIPDSGYFDFTSLNSEFEGTNFAFLVGNTPTNYRLSAIAVEKVPEPALLLGVGLVGIGLLTQKHRGEAV